MPSTDVTYTLAESTEVREATVPHGEFHAAWIAQREGVDPSAVNVLLSPAEWVTASVHNVGWECPCGNFESGSGFAFVTIDRVEVEPTEADWPRPLYACNECGRVIDQDSIRPNPGATNEDDSHRVAVIAGPGDITYKD